jgi:4-diphosphocytidyl-2-C-methyl-D-erythritol kinase
MQIKLQAPAKINIGLLVKDKRPDGYHNIETIMVPVKLFDSIVIKRIDKGINLKTDTNKVTSGKDNLIYKAAEMFFSHVNTEGGTEIKLIKKIPVGAGLGGGSSDAASVLLGLNKLHNNLLNFRQLKAIALKIGMDVAFFLYQQPCIATGRGEILQPIKIPKLHIALYLPKLSVSTKWAYEQIDTKIQNSKFKIQNYSLGVGLTERSFSLKLLKKRLIENELTCVNALVINTFENVVFDMHPDLLVVKYALLRSGADLVSLSGSGSALFGVFRKSMLCKVRKEFNKRVLITESV